MILLGLWLGGLGVADAVAGVSGLPRPRARTVGGVATAVTLTALCAVALGYRGGHVAVLASVVAVTVVGWLWVRSDSSPAANALVRLVLLSVGSDPREGETQLKGGRIIGPMERWLIFGFALAGSLPAAALVVTAKSLVRFPEIGRESTRVHQVTEYFLVGSLSSWLLALIPVPLLR